MARLPSSTGIKFGVVALAALAVVGLPWIAPGVELASAQAPVSAALPAGVAATINGQPLPQKIVDSFLKNGREELGLNQGSEDGQRNLRRLREAIINDQIDGALIVQEAKRRGLAPTAAQIDALEERVRALHGDAAGYDRFLAQNGFTRDEYREFVLAGNACASAVQTALARDITVSDDEVKSYYEAHRADADFQRPERVSAAHILINAQPGVLGARLEFERGLKAGPELQQAIAEETERRRALAEEVRRQAAAPGADFAALAKRYSDDPATRDAGGSLGTFHHGVHPVALDSAFFALKPGEVDPVVVQTQFGFHVAKTLDHLPAGVKSLEESSPEIRQRLAQPQQTAHLQDWLKAAREKAAIVVSPAEPKTL